MTVKNKEGYFFVRSSLAVYSVRDITKKRKQLEAQWEAFNLKKQRPNDIRTTILQSWERCKNYNLNPLQKQAPVTLSEDKLDELINISNLYQASLPVIKELYHQIECTGHLITLADDNGRIINLTGTSQVLKQAQQMNFSLGADWSENAAGSNAIGTSIALGKPIQIFSFEHYCQGVHPWVCSGAPIKEPFTGKILGAIDLTGPSDFAQPHSLILIQNIASMIQQRLYNSSIKSRQYLLDCYETEIKKRKSNHIIVVDEALNMVKAGSECKTLLQINDWSELLILPELNLLKKALLNCDEQEQELHLPSLQLNMFIRGIEFESKRTGFILYLEKIVKRQNSNLNHSSDWRNIIGQSTTLKEIVHKAQIVAPTDVTILLTGESGTGKEVFANAIHKESLRHDSPFIAVNCGAIPKDLITSELFGYEPGAFTGGKREGRKGKFEEANGGTLFLDEIGEMPLDLQVYLLRVLQERKVERLGSSKSIPIDVRVIAATNQDLMDLINKGKFRADLFYRLNGVELHLPSLRERKEDIPLLCRHFAISSANRYGKPEPKIGHEVLSFLIDYHWPGNIRELRNIIEHAVLFCDGNTITMDALPKRLDTSNEQSSSSIMPNSLEQEEKRKIEQLLSITGWNLSEVARQCGIARSTLYRKIKKYQL